MRSKKLSKFKAGFMLYLGVLVILALLVIIYMTSLLNEYEGAQPERCAEEAVMLLEKDASLGNFWNKYNISFPEAGKLEQGRNLKEDYLALYTSGNLTYSKKGGIHGEDELVYNIENDGFVLAEVKLRAIGAPVTKLAVFTYREWEIEEITPVVLVQDYIMTVPQDFTVKLNGMQLSQDNADIMHLLEDEIVKIQRKNRDTEYILSELCLPPVLELYDGSMTKGSYRFSGNRIVPELYDYTLKLPAAIEVTLNDSIHTGDESDGKIYHDIRLFTEAVVKASDLYGNTLQYDGKAKLPLTSTVIYAPRDYTVSVNGEDVPPAAVSSSVPADYMPLAEFVPGLPLVNIYDIAILEADAEIAVLDEEMQPVELYLTEEIQNLVPRPIGMDSVPEEVSSEIDVLKVAQNWSLFMSNDLPFSVLSKDLLKASYQYQVARAYATGTDITFTSKHTLMNPTFTDISVKNFVWLAENCFSVDISFVKHMRILGGMHVEDPMNDRFYFVKYDESDNGKNDAAWKLASMKEILDNEK